MTAHAVIEAEITGAATLAGVWQFSSTTTEADPGDGNFRYDAGTYGAVTEIFIAEENKPGTDFANVLALLNTGDRIYIQEVADSSRAAFWEVTGPPVDNGSWVSIPVAVGASSGFLVDGTECAVVFQFGTGIQDHGGLSGLTDDDHPQYWLLAGRSPGQTANLGLAVGDGGTIQQNPGADPGTITTPSSWLFTTDWSAIAASNNILRYGPVVGSSGGAVPAFIGLEADITVDNALFIFSAIRDTSVLEWTVNPGFAVQTLFLAQPTYKTTTAAINPSQSFILAAQPRFENDGAGAGRTVANFIGVSCSPTLACTTSGDALTVTNVTALQLQPIWSTVSGTTVNFGTVRGLYCNSPLKGIFFPGAGVETMTAYYGVDFTNITFAATAAKAVIRSALNSNGVLNHFLLNNGSAPSDLGSSHVYFDDNFGVAYGGVGVGAFDAWVSWNGAGGYLRTFFIANGDALRWSNPGSDRFLFDNDGGSTTGEYNFNCARFSMGAQTGAVGNQVGNFVTPARTIGVGGDWADFLLTQAGNLTVGGLGMGRVSAWVINPISYASSSGSVANADTLTVGGFPTSSPGVTITERQSLYVIAGRSRFRSAMEYDPINPSTLAAGNNNNWGGLLTGTNNNNMRHWARITPDGGGTSAITGIDATQAQDGDCFKLTNIGTVAMTLNDQDVASTASNRIISPTGANYTLGANESAEIIRDATTDRWRILYGSGA